MHGLILIIEGLAGLLGLFALFCVWGAIVGFIPSFLISLTAKWIFGSNNSRAWFLWSEAFFALLITLMFFIHYA